MKSSFNFSIWDKDFEIPLHLQQEVWLTNTKLG